jgi:hypothetical protein
MGYRSRSVDARVRIAVGDDLEADVCVSSSAEASALTSVASSDAAVALALLLRGFEGRSVGDGLVAESATYSMLQGSSAHRAWLASRPSARARRPGEVRMVRDGDVLTLTLARPEVRNAFDAATRDALLEGLAVAAADRVEARVHGACVGAGAELPAFAGRVVARPDAWFQLPELAMGLVPGAGGTVSLPRRIGRQRTMWLALTGAKLDAPTALAWGLVDAVDSGA